MVLEKWIGGKIRQLLGHYVEIDSEALKVAVWNGELVLNNLRLIPGPIPGTPVSVVEGKLARLELHVPWQHLKSRPVVIKVEGLEVVYGPRGASTPEEREAEAQKQLERKRELLRGVDEDGGGGAGAGEALALAEDEAEGEEEGAEDSTFLERLTGTILRNVEVTITGVRMVYRDSTSVPAHPFSVVATLDSLSVQSCDASWSPQFVDQEAEETSQLFRKRVTLSSLSLRFESGGAREELLRPLTAELRIESYAEDRRIGGSEANRRRPAGVARHTLRLSLDRLELRLSKLALVCCVNVAQKSDVRVWRAYLQYRPVERPARGTARQWWDYALRGAQYTGARDKMMAQRRWSELAWHVGVRARYISLYKASRRRSVTGLAEQPQELSSEDLSAMRELEDRLDLRAILLFRRVADAEVEVERRTTKQALRSYQRVKDATMGSRSKRMKMKMAMSKEEYEAMKPFKPSEMMDVTSKQRRHVYSELGVGTIAEDDAALAMAVQIDLQCSLESISVALTPDAAPELDHKLLFRLGATRIRTQMRSMSRRVECEVASVVLLDELAPEAAVDASWHDGTSWHDGKVLSVYPSSEGGHAITAMVDTLAGDVGQGEIECRIAPMLAVYSKPAHVFVMELADAMSARLDATSHAFITTAKSRVTRFTARAKAQLKSRLHKTQPKGEPNQTLVTCCNR